MNIFLNQEVRRLFTAVLLLLLGMGVCSQLLAQRAAVELKNALIAHDAALVGALIEQGMEPTAAAAALTGPTSPAQEAAGTQAMARAGVTENLDYRFLPESKAFAERGSLAALALVLVSAAGLLAVIYAYLVQQERRTLAACQAVEQFMRTGEQSGARLALADAVEGSQAQFFSAVNGMAASLTAHLQKEQHDRAFLKEIISDISHQLKTPLAALHMYSEIIRSENSSSDVIDEFVQKCQRELNRMEELIQNLLKLARLDAGAILLEKQPVCLKDFLQSVVERFSVRAEVEAKELRLGCPAGLAFEADENWLAEAAGNLIKNALDHTSAGGWVEVRGEETSLVVKVTVKDNGAGIHPDDLPYIFKRFYRSRFSQDRQGVGIGLTLARSIVEKHGGSLTVESEPGQGAAFHMVFPKLTNM